MVTSCMKKRFVDIFTKNYVFSDLWFICVWWPIWLFPLIIAPIISSFHSSQKLGPESKNNEGFKQHLLCLVLFGHSCALAALLTFAADLKAHPHAPIRKSSWKALPGVVWQYIAGCLLPDDSPLPWIILAVPCSHQRIQVWQEWRQVVFWMLMVRKPPRTITWVSFATFFLLIPSIGQHCIHTAYIHWLIRMTIKWERAWSDSWQSYIKQWSWGLWHNRCIQNVRMKR